MQIQVFILAVLLGTALSAPTTKPLKKFPKKYDKNVHSIDEKKENIEKSSYTTYDDVKDRETDLMLPPPPPEVPSSYNWTPFIFPNPWLLPPTEDSYSSSLGDPMDDMEVPSITPKEEEPQSYIVYLKDGFFPLTPPGRLPYATIPEASGPQEANGPQEEDSELPIFLQPPAMIRETSPMKSSFSSVAEKDSTR